MLREFQPASRELVIEALNVTSHNEVERFLVRHNLPGTIVAELKQRFTRYLDYHPQSNWKILSLMKSRTEEKLEEGIVVMREMQEILNPKSHLPLVIEKAQVAITNMISRERPGSTDERDILLEPWERGLEQMVKAREVTEMMGIILNRNGKRQVLPPEKRVVVERWVYGVIEDSYQGSKQGYSDFSNNVIDLITQTNAGLAEMSNVGIKGIFEREKLLMPWLYMLLTGDETKYMQRMQEVLGNNNNVKPAVQVGVATSDYILDDGSLRQYKPTLISSLVRMVKNDDGRPIEIKRGEALACGLAGDEGGRKSLITNMLEKLRNVRLETNYDRLSKIGLKEIAIWLTLPLNPNSDIVGSQSVINQLIATHSGVAKADCTLAIPLAPREAQTLFEWNVTGVDKDSVIRRALLLAHEQRVAGISINGGFGSTKDVASTPFWASLAYNLSQPKPDFILTSSLLSKASKAGFGFDEEKWVAFFAKIFSQRVSTLWVEVMGGGVTVDEDVLNKSKVDNPASMMVSAYYLQQVERQLGLIEHRGATTLGIGHSMGGELRLHEKLQQPYSTKSVTQTLAIAPVVTAEEGAMPFLYKGLNKLTKLMIDLGNSSEDTWQATLGELGLDVGALIGIVENLNQKSTNPKREPGFGNMIGEQLTAIHNLTLFEQIKRLGWQMAAILNTGNEYLIDELIKPAMMVGGSGLTVLYGDNDPVLDFKKNWKALLKAGIENIKPRIVLSDKAEQLEWLSSQSNVDNRSLLIQAPGLPHYIEATQDGQRLIIATAMRLLGIKRYEERSK